MSTTRPWPTGCAPACGRVSGPSGPGRPARAAPAPRPATARTPEPRPPWLWAWLGGAVSIQLEPDRRPGRVAQVAPPGGQLFDQEQPVSLGRVPVALDLRAGVRGPVVDDLDHQAARAVDDHDGHRALAAAGAGVQHGVGD